MVRQGVNPLCNPLTNIFMLVISINRNKEQKQNGDISFFS
jgi:hypothetical protein